MDNGIKVTDDLAEKLKSGREYIGIDKIDGPLLFIKNTHNVGYRELVECVDSSGAVRYGSLPS